MYDGQVGRWMVIDPMAEKFHSLTPYHYCLNNPLIFVDPDGEDPYPITIRSFHPAKGFGGSIFGPGMGKNYSGDNRGFSNEKSGSVTSRINHTVTVDPEAGTLSYNPKTDTYSDPSHWMNREATASPDGYACIDNTVAGKTVGFQTGYEGKNPLVPAWMCPEINVEGTFAVTQANDKLTIAASINGDNFPNTEMFIQDASKQSVFLGVDVRAAGNDSNPTILFGGATENIMNINLTINLDKKGNFVSVTQGDKTYTIKEWNKAFTNANPNPVK